MATHASILAWRIPWREEPGGLYSLWGCKRVRHDLVTKQRQCTPTLPLALGFIKTYFNKRKSMGLLKKLKQNTGGVEGSLLPVPGLLSVSPEADTHGYGFLSEILRPYVRLTGT